MCPCGKYPCLLRYHECLTQMYLLHHAFVPKVNLRNTINGSTPLHFAAQESERGDQKGRLLCVKMLLAAGAERDIAVHLICPCSSCLYVPAASGPREICRIIAGASRIRCRATLTCAWRWADRRSRRMSPTTKRRRRTSSSSGRTLSAARCSPAPALGGSEQACRGGQPTFSRLCARAPRPPSAWHRVTFSMAKGSCSLGWYRLLCGVCIM